MMFDVGWSELLLIAVVALLVIGPKELPEVMRNLGRAMNKMRRSADDFRRQFEESVRDTGYDELQQNLREFSRLNPAAQVKEEIDRALQAEPSAPNTAGAATNTSGARTDDDDDWEEGDLPRPAKAPVTQDAAAAVPPPSAAPERPLRAGAMPIPIDSGEAGPSDVNAEAGVNGKEVNGAKPRIEAGNEPQPEPSAAKAS